MSLSFVYNGFEYEAIQVTGSMISKDVVCVDAVFYNEHAPTRNRFAEPPIGTRSAWQRIKFSEYLGEGTAWERARRPEEVGKKEREEAVRHFDRLADRFKGFFIPDIDHRWHKRVESLLLQNKLVYTTVSHKRNAVYILRRYPIR